MVGSDLEVARRLASEVAVASTLLVSPLGPARPTPNDLGGPATWWVNYEGAVRHAAAPEFVDSPASLQVRSRTPAVFDLVIFDPRAISREGIKGIVSLRSTVSRAKFVVIRSPPDEVDPDDQIPNLIGALFEAGFTRDTKSALALLDHSVALVPGNRTPSEVVSSYEAAISEAQRMRARAVTQRPSAVCDDPSCVKQFVTIRHQSMIDRDRLNGVLARSLNIQYDLDHHRFALAKSQAALTHSEAKLANVSRKLQSLRKSRSFRLSSKLSKLTSGVKGRKAADPTPSQRSIDP